MPPRHITRLALEEAQHVAHCLRAPLSPGDEAVEVDGMFRAIQARQQRLQQPVCIELARVQKVTLVLREAGSIYGTKISERVPWYSTGRRRSPSP
jgi:hypothetical protein